MATRLLLDELLEHPLREALVDLVGAEPGISFLGLFDRLKPVPAFSHSLGYGSLSYHLQQLERFGVLTTRKAGRFRRHYLNGCPKTQGQATRHAILSTPPAPELVRLIRDHPGLNQQTLWKRFRETKPLSRQAVGYHLVRLERAGLLSVVRSGRGKSYRLAPDAPIPAAPSHATPLASPSGLVNAAVAPGTAP